MRKLFTLSALFIMTFMVKAQVPEKLPIDPQVRFGKLDNGLTYYIRQNAYPEKRATFYIAQKVGSMQEEDNQAGLAHFLEHMAFNGTKHFPGRKTMLNYMETIGAKFGANINAHTGFDETVYKLIDIPMVRPSVIDSSLLVLHDWSGFIKLEDAEIDKERSIIREEWRTSTGADLRIWEKQLPVIFKGSKYADRLPIGKMDVIDNFKYQTLKDYYKQWYRPDLQAIIVVGDIDPNEIETKIKTLFSDIPKPENPAERVYFPVNENPEPIVSVVTDPEATMIYVNLYIKHDIVPSQIKETQAGLVIDFIKSLASTMLSDRLKEISQQANASFAASFAYDGNFIVSQTKDAWTAIAIAKEGQIDETLACLVRENERIRQFGFTEAEVERAKATLLKQYENSYNNRNKQLNRVYIDEYVRSFTDGEGIPGIEYEYNFIKQFAPMITAQAVNSSIQPLLTDKNIVVAITGPEKEGITYPTNKQLLDIIQTVTAEKITAYTETVSNEPLLSKLPQAGKVLNSETDSKLGATVWTLSNGMRVVLKKTDYKDDEILMSSIANGGTSNIPVTDVFNAGMASMVPYLGGIGNFSTTDLKKVLAGKSVKINPYVSKWNQGFSGSSSVKDIETLLQLTHLYFTAPRKDEGAYSSIMDMIKNQLKNMSSDPSYIMQNTVREVMYGDNPYMKEMELEDAEKLNYDRIIEIYKEVFANPGSFVLTLVGNVDETALKPLVEKYLASLPSGNKDIQYKKINVDINKGKLSKVFEQEMKTPKTSVFEQYNGIFKRDQKTNITLSTLKQILDIVYVRTVREEEGGTYGVRISTDFARVPEGRTVVQMTFDTDPERASKLTPIIDREMKNIAENGSEDADLQKSKEYMVKKFQEDEKINGYWTGILNAKYFYNEDNYSNYLSIVNSITKEDIQQFVKALLSQGNSVEVIMNPKQ